MGQTYEYNGKKYALSQETATAYLPGDEWGETKDVTVKVKFGFDVDFAVRNNQEPHFSITVDILDSRGRDIGGGADHKTAVKAFPHLSNYVAYHLASFTGEPMHYIANAQYWLEQHLGCSKFESRPFDPDYLEAFKHTIVFGALPEDEAQLQAILDHYSVFTGYESKTVKRMIRDDLKPVLTKWLKSRRDALQAKFVNDMVTLGVVVELQHE